MAFRLGTILLLLALAMVVESSFKFDDANSNNVAPSDLDSLHSRGIATCNGQVGDCIDTEEEMMMDSEASRRVLSGRNYISYEALKKNYVACNRHGNSYYNCNSRGKANPYQRGCNVITKCARSGR